MEQPSYYAVLSADVRYNKSLTSDEKLLYCEIVALSNNENGYCDAPNSYFTKLYRVPDISISNWINHLKEQGYLLVKTGHNTSRKIYPLSSPITIK